MPTLSPRTRAFTAMELLATIGMVGILGSLSIALVTGLGGKAEDQKIRSNVESLNRAILAYETHGGNLPQGATAQQVISKLKTVGDSMAQRTFPGFRGSFVDGRLIAVNVAANAKGPRAIWDSATQQFNVSHSGSGVRFELQDEVTADHGQAEQRQTRTPGFAQNSTWVWDYQDAGPVAAMARPVVHVQDIELSSTPKYRSPIQLAPPIFSIPGGSYPGVDFPLSVTLSNPSINPLGTVIKYSLNSDPWQIYDGTPLAVEPDTHIVAYADSQDDQRYFSSFARTHYYERDQSLLYFSGQSAGEFRNAEGGPRMEVTYVDQGLDASFEWGRGVSGYDTGSILSFQSDAFTDVAAESWFRLGGLKYFNSTISMATQATNVWLDLAIDFATPSISETFSFELALENTVNRSNQTANENADYVRITDPNSAFTTSLNGQDYELQLQFGYLGADGFATVDQFHVHEGAGATADIWGYFAPAEGESDTLSLP